jgi:hypothetical protein
MPGSPRHSRPHGDRAGPRVRPHLPGMWPHAAGDHANGRLPVFLRVHELQGPYAPQTRGLLCFLFLRHGRLSADPGGEAMLQRAGDLIACY